MECESIDGPGIIELALITFYYTINFYKVYIYIGCEIGPVSRSRKGIKHLDFRDLLPDRVWGYGEFFARRYTA